MNLYHTGLSELYKEIEALGDPLTGISDRIDFEKIRPILSDLYENDTEKGGRPNYDPILMVKILLLQQWYSLLLFQKKWRVVNTSPLASLRRPLS